MLSGIVAPEGLESAAQTMRRARFPAGEEGLGGVEVKTFRAGHGQRQHARASFAQDLQHTVVGGRFHGHDVARFDEDGDEHLHGLGAAGDGDELRAFDIRAAGLQPRREQFAERGIALGVMIGKHLRALVGKGTGERGLEFLGGQGIEAGNAGGEIDQAGLVGLAHKIDETSGGAEGTGFSHARKGPAAFLNRVLNSFILR